MIELVCVGVIGGSVVAVAVFEDKLLVKGCFVESDTLHYIIVAILTTGGIGTAFWFIWEMAKRFILYV